MDHRVEFVKACREKNRPSIAAIADQFGISEKTAHKWLRRAEAGGVAELGDRSRRPHSSPARTSDEVQRVLIALRSMHRHRGPKKLLVALAQKRPDLRSPSRSTAAEILRRAGLTTPRKRRSRIPRGTPVFAAPTAPNQVWSIDHKGNFTVERRNCYPLTITDNFSRFILLCRALPSTRGAEVFPLLRSVFREHGLPLAMRSDNGPPFGARGIGGLSRLSIYMTRLGIRVEHIVPGKPQQNGRHERMHLTLKNEAILPTGSTWVQQQHAFDRFVFEFNEDRPHESLEMKRPAELHQPSPRSFPERLPETEYSTGNVVRRVRTHGEIKWNGKLVFLGEALSGEAVGLRESTSDGWWDLHFGPMHLGLLHSDGRLLPRRRALWNPNQSSPMSSD